MFPIELFDHELEGDVKREGKHMVRLLGKFLLLGTTTPSSIEVNDLLLEREITTAKAMMVVDEWFIDLVEIMIMKISDESSSLTFLNIKDTIEKHVKVVQKWRIIGESICWFMYVGIF